MFNSLVTIQESGFEDIFLLLPACFPALKIYDQIDLRNDKVIEVKGKGRNI